MWEVTNELLAPLLTIDNVLVKLAHVLLAKKSFCPPLAEVYLKEQKLIPRAVYVLLFKLPPKTEEVSNLSSYIILFLPINVFGKWIFLLKLQIICFVSVLPWKVFEVMS